MDRTNRLRMLFVLFSKMGRSGIQRLFVSFVDFEPNSLGDLRCVVI